MYRARVIYNVPSEYLTNVTDTGSSSVPRESSSCGTLMFPAISSKGISSILYKANKKIFINIGIIFMRAMLSLRIILFAGCWGLLVSKEHLEWNSFLEFVSTYNKEYQDDPNELANRFKVFKVTRDHYYPQCVSY